MTSQYRHRRTSNPATAFPNPIEPGEIAVNTANRQLAVGDAQSGVTGTPLPLLALRFFDARAIYAIGDMVYEGGVVYRANVACGPETFTPAHWDILAGAIDPLYVQRAGDTMAGFLTLHADPTAVMHAATKQFVDAGLAGKSVVIASPTPPTGVPDNTLWWSSDEGVLLIRYNDGIGPPQWVITSPQPDPGTFIAKSGDTMTGLLVLSGDPVTPLGAATQQYTIAIAAAAANTRVAKTGDAMSGPLLIAAAPTANDQVANKLYVDGAVAAKSSTVVADTPPAGAPDGTLWFESDSGLSYIKVNDGNSSQWVSMLATGGDAVLYNTVQALSVTQASRARGNIAAAAQDALAYNGMQINGDGVVSQEFGYHGSSTLSAGGGSFCDGWRSYKAGSMAGGAVVATSGVAPIFPGFQTCLAATISTAQASLAAGEFTSFIQNIEGYRIARLAWGSANAQPLTIAFWSAHNRTGLYSGSVRNGDGSRSCGFTYTQLNANIGQYNVVTIPGCTDGTWNVTNGIGLILTFAMAAGSTYTAPAAGVWYAANYTSVVGQINAVAATSDVFRITGLLVLPGTEAPSAARSPYIMRSYDQELLTCQRYYERRQFVVQGSPINNVFTHWAVAKRAAPTIVGTIDSGTGAAFVIIPWVTTGGSSGLATQGFYQTGPNSTASIAMMVGDARL